MFHISPRKEKDQFSVGLVTERNQKVGGSNAHVLSFCQSIFSMLFSFFGFALFYFWFCFVLFLVLFFLISGCSDYLDNCQVYDQMGLCNIPKYFELMKKYCEKTCHLCSK